MCSAVSGSLCQAGVMSDRRLTEREAFRAARYFIEQFNEREKSEGLELLVEWMSEGKWNDPLATSDPAQWYDWVKSVDRVMADRSFQPNEV